MTAIRRLHQARNVPKAFQSLVIPIVEQVLVVKRQLVLKAELHVRKRSVVRPHRERVVLRSEEASVERQNAGETRARPQSSRNVQPKPKGEK